MSMVEITSFEPLGNWLETLVSTANSILDAGCGPKGGHWWAYKTEASSMVAVDLYRQPSWLPSNTQFIQTDIATFGESSPYPAHFDLVVADHILEHVYFPERVVLGFNRLLKTDGVVHIGVPDASNFTDRFYRLIHGDTGGHVSLFTRQNLTEMLEQAGFENLAILPWGDDWGWFRTLFDWNARGIQGITQDDIEYIADVFSKELTLDKGYFYGWEGVFIKRAEKSFPVAASPRDQHIQSDAMPKSKPSENRTADVYPSHPPQETLPVLLSPEDLIELHWIAQKTLRLKKTVLYRFLKRLWQSK
jgi:predicted SAM-dependent methyltransferase